MTSVEDIYPSDFSRWEFVESHTASYMGIDNTPRFGIVELNMVNMAHALQKIRSTIFMNTGAERSISITSGFRCQGLNDEITKVTGSKSRHISGLAADIRVAGMSPEEVIDFVKDRMPDFRFHKMINEYDSWVHISFPHVGEAALCKFMNAKKENGKTIYELVD